jgi:hypothetical protein
MTNTNRSNAPKAELFPGTPRPTIDTGDCIHPPETREKRVHE